MTPHRAVLLTFVAAGGSFASWASRIPDAKVTLDLSAGELGLVLLFGSFGSLLGLPISGRLADAVGADRTVLLGAVLNLIGMAGVSLGVDVLESSLMLAGSLFVVGFGVGIWDVGMNLEGAEVERQLGRTVMPLYHAAFSGGTVAAALIGVVATAANIPVSAHLLVAATLLLAVVVLATRSFLPAVEEHEEQVATSGRSAWTEPRTLLVGVVVLAAAFTEGTANDWMSVAFVEGHGVARWAGVMAFATFLTAMTLGRILGARLLDSYGRVPVLRVLFSMAVVGCALVVFAPMPVAYLGAVVWGVGASLGFPVGMSAAGDDPRRAAMRISVVATIGYAAFLVGPPLLGFLGDHYGVLRSLSVVGVVALLALLLVPATAPESAESSPETASG